MFNFRSILLCAGLVAGGCWLNAQDSSLTTSTELALPSVHEYIHVETKPEAINLDEVRQKIGYPLAALQQKISGTLYCRVLVDEEGMPREHVITRSLGHEIDARVGTFIGELRFHPARRNDTAVMYWVNLAFHFDGEAARHYEGKRIDPVNFLTHSSGNNRREAREALAQGLAALADDRLHDARWSLQKAIRLTPHRKKPRGQILESLFVAHYYLGRTEARLERWEAATLHWTEAIGLASSNRIGRLELFDLIPQAYLQRSRARLASGHILAAFDDCQWVLSHYDANEIVAQAYLQRSRVQFHLQEYSNALNDVQQSIDLAPAQGRAYLQKARILIDLGGHAAACEALAQAAASHLENDEINQFYRLQEQACPEQAILGSTD